MCVCKCVHSIYFIMCVWGRKKDRERKQLTVKGLLIIWGRKDVNTFIYILKKGKFINLKFHIYTKNNGRKNKEGLSNAFLPPYLAEWSLTRTPGRSRTHFPRACLSETSHLSWELIEVHLGSPDWPPRPFTQPDCQWITSSTTRPSNRTVYVLSAQKPQVSHLTHLSIHLSDIPFNTKSSTIPLGAHPDCGCCYKGPQGEHCDL